MKDRLDVLYAADDGYAPFLGVSMYSLFKNNVDMEEIRVYAVLDNVSDANREKLQQVAGCFNRELVLVGAERFNEQLAKLGVPRYRGNYATNYRLFFDAIVDEGVERLLYIDCDTAVCGSLRTVIECDFEEYPAAAVLDSLGSRYKHIVGFPPEVPYFNAGVLVIDVKNWKERHVSEEILNHIKNVRSRYCNPDQDLLNINLRGKVKILGPEYNFQPIHRAYPDKAYEKVYGFRNYYTPEQVEHARRSPVILHMYRFLGQFPWHRNNMHPDTAVFDEYLALSPWADYRKQKTKCCSVSFKIERFLYMILPKTWFLYFFAFMQEWSFRRQNENLARGNAGSREKECVLQPPGISTENTGC